MTRAILSSPAVATPDNGDLLAPVCCYTDDTGRLWAGTEGCTPGPVAEVVALPAAGLVVVTTGTPGNQEVYLLDGAEWHGIKAEAAALPQLATFEDYRTPEQHAAHKVALADVLAKRAVTLSLQGSDRISATRTTHTDKDGDYEVVDVAIRRGAETPISLAWDPTETTGCLVINEGNDDLTPAQARDLRALLAHPVVDAWIDGAAK